MNTADTIQITAKSDAFPPAQELRLLQVGIGWAPERGGNGLDRMFHGLAMNLGSVGVETCSMVLGTERIASDSIGDIQTVAGFEDSLPVRMSALRRGIHDSLRSRAIDLVAAHFALHIAPSLDLLRDTPLVVHFHGPWAQESRVEGDSWATVRLKKIIERTVYGRGDRFIVLSTAFRDVLVTDYGVSATLIDVVQGGVDIDRFNTGLTRAQARAELGWPIDRPVVLCVRRLCRRMGLGNLVESMNVVRERFPDALLLIAGKGPMADELQKLIVEHGLESHIRLLGFVPDELLPAAYRAADVSVVPSTSLEGFGLTTVESLASGTPVLVTPVGGLPEVVSDLSTDLVFPDSRSDTMGDYLSDVLDGRLRVPSSEACSDYAANRYSWPVVAGRVRAVYRRVLS